MLLLNAIMHFYECHLRIDLAESGVKLSPIGKRKVIWNSQTQEKTGLSPIPEFMSSKWIKLRHHQQLNHTQLLYA
jgi:hypothetical protein